METPYDILRARVADLDKLISIMDISPVNPELGILEKLQGAIERKIRGMIWIIENFPNNPYDIVDLGMLLKLVVLLNRMEEDEPGYDDLAKVVILLLDKVSPDGGDRTGSREQE